MTLRELIKEAELAIRTYRHPDVSECHYMLNEIIVAAKLGNISKDSLVYVEIRGGKVKLRTEYSVRSCYMEDDYEFPERIIDADDPVKAATLWGVERQVKKARSEVAEARCVLFHREAELSKAEAALIAVRLEG